MSDPRLERPEWRGRTNVDALTIACIEHAEQIVRDERPDIAHDFVCTKGSYQDDDGTTTSGNTHRLGGVVDLRWCGHEFCLLALRRAGTFAYHRTPEQGPWVDHIHLGVLGHPFMDPSAERQEDSYRARRDGLRNNGPDDGPRLNPIPRPEWPWPPEDDMPYRDWPQLDKDALLADVVDAVLDAPVDNDPEVSVRKALRRGGRSDDELALILANALARQARLAGQ